MSQSNLNDFSDLKSVIVGMTSGTIVDNEGFLINDTIIITAMDIITNKNTIC